MGTEGEEMEFAGAFGGEHGLGEDDAVAAVDQLVGGGGADEGGRGAREILLLQ